MKPIKRIFSCMFAIILVACSLAFPNFVYAGENHFSTNADGSGVYATPNGTSDQFYLISVSTYFPLIAYTGNYLVTSVGLGCSTQIEHITICLYTEQNSFIFPLTITLIANGQLYKGNGIKRDFENRGYIVVPYGTRMVNWFPFNVTYAGWYN